MHRTPTCCHSLFTPLMGALLLLAGCAPSYEAAFGTSTNTTLYTPAGQAVQPEYTNAWQPLHVFAAYSYSQAAPHYLDAILEDFHAGRLTGYAFDEERIKAGEALGETNYTAVHEKVQQLTGRDQAFDDEFAGDEPNLLRDDLGQELLWYGRVKMAQRASFQPRWLVLHVYMEDFGVANTPFLAFKYKDLKRYLNDCNLDIGGVVERFGQPMYTLYLGEHDFTKQAHQGYYTSHLLATGQLDKELSALDAATPPAMSVQAIHDQAAQQHIPYDELLVTCNIGEPALFGVPEANWGAAGQAQQAELERRYAAFQEQLRAALPAINAAIISGELPIFDPEMYTKPMLPVSYVEAVTYREHSVQGMTNEALLQALTPGTTYSLANRFSVVERWQMEQGKRQASAPAYAVLLYHDPEVGLPTRSIATVRWADLKALNDASVQAFVQAYEQGAYYAFLVRLAEADCGCFSWVSVTIEQALGYAMKAKQGQGITWGDRFDKSGDLSEADRAALLAFLAQELGL